MNIWRLRSVARPAPPISRTNSASPGSRNRGVSQVLRPVNTHRSPELAAQARAGYISLSPPPDLTFSDHVNLLISTYRVYRTRHRTKPEASSDPLLDESMVLLHDIVQIRSRSTVDDHWLEQPPELVLENQAPTPSVAWRDFGSPDDFVRSPGS